jgi:hypothetical protein
VATTKSCKRFAIKEKAKGKYKILFSDNGLCSPLSKEHLTEQPKEVRKRPFSYSDHGHLRKRGLDCYDKTSLTIGSLHKISSTYNSEPKLKRMGFFERHHLPQIDSKSLRKSYMKENSRLHRNEGTIDNPGNQEILHLRSFNRQFE